MGVETSPSPASLDCLFPMILSCGQSGGFYEVHIVQETDQPRQTSVPAMLEVLSSSVTASSPFSQAASVTRFNFAGLALCARQRTRPGSHAREGLDKHPKFVYFVLVF